MNPKRIVIVGGVAGGATCAARLRRLDEAARIVVLDRGDHVSFANCGLPYYVGDVIREEENLLLSSPQLFRDRFNIEVRTRHEALAIDRTSGELAVRELATRREYREPYDALVLSPGAAPIRPPLQGIDLPGIFTLRSIPDSREIREWIAGHNPQQVVVVGGGFIGLEMADNLAHRGIKVTIVEMMDQLMPPLDPEMAAYLSEHLIARGVRLHMGDGIAGFEPSRGGGLLVRTQAGAALRADLVVLAIGVRPETRLARDAGLQIGERGGIKVDEQMHTSDPRIWAVGDAVEVCHTVTRSSELIPLAGPANRQARVAADAICGRTSTFRGVQATSVCGIFGLTVALTGATEKMLRRAGIDDFKTVWLHPTQHVGYYPGATSIHLKLLFRASDGLVLGAQAVGEEGVARRIDVLALAIQMKATVFDLEEAELCYAPQFGAAKDAVNLAGMAASNVLRGDLNLAPWQELDGTRAFILDVRDPHEFLADSIDGAVNIPLSELRARTGELPRDREIWVNCGVGQRSYYACRILTQYGLAARSLSGGYQTYRVLYPEGLCAPSIR
ncbi:MAG: FAD-dependent oxidoreductase [Acidobacteriota bacterium]